MFTNPRFDMALPIEQEFYEHTRSKVLTMLKTTDIMVLDTICGEFVANLRAGDDSTSVIKLNPPYNLMTDLDKISMVGVKGLKPSTSRSQTERAINCATPR